MPSKTQTLFAGPYVGEFGYELMTWQAGVRKMARQFKRRVISCRESSAALYQDFATDFIFTGESVERCARRCADDIGKEAKREIKRRKRPGDEWIDARHLGDGKFIRYGKNDPEKGFDIVYHARMTPKSKLGNLSLERNWPKRKWESLADRVYDRTNWTVCWIGLSSEAIWVEGRGVNMLDAPLDQVMDVLASSRLIVGPSSGPMHLAALCGCPSLVWCRVNGNVPPRGTTLGERYRTKWNPFRTPVSLIDGYDVDDDVVFDRIKDLLE